MNRRNLLKVLPLAALAGATVKIGDVDAKAVEIKPDKKYVFVVHDNVPQAEVTALARDLRARGIDATVIANAENIRIYELQ